MLVFSNLTLSSSRDIESVALLSCILLFCEVVMFSESELGILCKSCYTLYQLNHVTSVLFFRIWYSWHQRWEVCVGCYPLYYLIVLTHFPRFCVETCGCSQSWKITVRLGITCSSHDCFTKTPLCNQQIWVIMSRWVEFCCDLKKKKLYSDSLSYCRRPAR